MIVEADLVASASRNLVRFQCCAVRARVNAPDALNVLLPDWKMEMPLNDRKRDRSRNGPDTR